MKPKRFFVYPSGSYARFGVETDNVEEARAAFRKLVPSVAACEVRSFVVEDGHGGWIYDVAIVRTAEEIR